MSTSELARILSYALVDEGFGTLLASDPNGAVRAVDGDLTPNELRALDDFSITDFQQATVLLGGLPGEP